MSYRKVEDFKKTPRLDLTRNGQGTQSEFVLLSAKQVESKTYPGKMNMVYSVRYIGKDLPELVKEFAAEFPEFESDHQMTIWGSSILDRKLAEAEIGPDGVQTFVEYLGELASTVKGHKAMKNFDVYFDDGVGEAVTPTAETTPAGAKKKTPF